MFKRYYRVLGLFALCEFSIGLSLLSPRNLANPNVTTVFELFMPMLAWHIILLVGPLLGYFSKSFYAYFFLVSIPLLLYGATLINGVIKGYFMSFATVPTFLILGLASAIYAVFLWKRQK